MFEPGEADSGHGNRPGGKEQTEDQDKTVFPGSISQKYQQQAKGH